MTVKRYTPTQCCQHDGTYVYYTDYQELEKQLEAERQRADDLQSWKDLMLKSSLAINANERLKEEIAVLKAKLANPIVLHVIPNLNGDDWCWKDEVIKAINVAGFTVKGYSPEQSVFVGARP